MAMDRARVERIIREGDEARKECTTEAGVEYDEVIRPALLAYIDRLLRLPSREQAVGPTVDADLAEARAMNEDSKRDQAESPAEALVQAWIKRLPTALRNTIQHRHACWLITAITEASRHQALPTAREQVRDGLVAVERRNMLNEPETGNPNWPDPTREMLDDPTFNAIWNVIKSWDVNVPHAYCGYCGATGNHVRAIMEALPKDPQEITTATPTREV